MGEAGSSGQSGRGPAEGGPRTRRRPRRSAIRDLEIDAAALQVGLATEGDEEGLASGCDFLHRNGLHLACTLDVIW